ncbi:Hypothetical_protein [Hexamita inflata]|uniref:Hypothetical_protein n=1 Tax=Hexamita inflata TaxID=28002 RepID=A0AA86NXM1_9EUKA|nr:Hypothetical protein HINF_LOCUS15553 [Hexamita inflata]
MSKVPEHHRIFITRDSSDVYYCYADNKIYQCDRDFYIKYIIQIKSFPFYNGYVDESTQKSVDSTNTSFLAQIVGRLSFCMVFERLYLLQQSDVVPIKSFTNAIDTITYNNLLLIVYQNRIQFTDGQIAINFNTNVKIIQIGTKYLLLSNQGLYQVEFYQDNLKLKVLLKSLRQWVNIKYISQNRELASFQLNQTHFSYRFSHDKLTYIETSTAPIIYDTQIISRFPPKDIEQNHIAQILNTNYTKQLLMEITQINQQTLTNTEKIQRIIKQNIQIICQYNQYDIFSRVSFFNVLLLHSNELFCKLSINILDQLVISNHPVSQIVISDLVNNDIYDLCISSVLNCQHKAIMIYLIKQLIQKKISDNDLFQQLVKKHFELGNDYEQQQLISLLTQNKYEKYLEFLQDSLIKINKLGIQDQVTTLQQQIIDNAPFSIVQYKNIINSRSRNGWTCLMFASIFNQSQIKTFQSQIGQKNQNNQTALMLIIIFEVFNKLDDKQMQEFVELEARSVDDHKKSCLQHVLDKEFLIDAVQAKAWFKCLFNLEYDLIQKSDKINQSIKRLPYSMQELISPEMFRKTEIASAEKMARKVSTLISKQEVQTKKQGKIDKLDLVKIVNSNNCKSYIETLQADQNSSEFIKLLEQYKPWLVEYLPKESVISYFEQYLTDDIPTNLMSTSQELAVLYIKYSKIQLDESILKQAAALNKSKIIECFDDKQLLAHMVTNMPENEAEIVKFITSQPLSLQKQYLSSLQTVIIGNNVNVINALFNKQCFQQLSYIPEYMINSFLNKTFEFYKTDEYCPKKYVIKNLLILAPKQVAQILNKYSLERFHHEYLIELAVQAKAWDAVKLVDQKILRNINPSVKTLNTMISCCKNEESMINFIHCFGFTVVRKTVNLQQYHVTIYKTAKTLNKQNKFIEEMKKIVHLYGWNLLHMYTREGYTDHFQRNNFNYKVTDVFGTNLDHRIKLADYADEEWEE